jgi:hypothetical protein
LQNRNRNDSGHAQISTKKQTEKDTGVYEPKYEPLALNLRSPGILYVLYVRYKTTYTASFRDSSPPNFKMEGGPALSNFGPLRKNPVLTRLTRSGQKFLWIENWVYTLLVGLSVVGALVLGVSAFSIPSLS